MGRPRALSRAILFLVASCGRSDHGAPPGSDGGRCYPNSTCDLGLVCATSGRCVDPDAPCADVSCSGHGTCANVGGRAVCLCAAGYAPVGLSCVAGAPTDYVPSNVGDRVGFDAGDAELVVGDDAYRYWIVDTDSGSITAYDGPDPASAGSRVVREAGTGPSAGGIGYTALPLLDGLSAGVFNVARLSILEGAELVGVGGRSLLIMAAGEVVVDGLLTVAADHLPGQRYPGPGGFAGASSPYSSGFGAGGGTGNAVGNNHAGGGGGHGAPGGAGGCSDAAGGAAYGSPELIPLSGGSGGGAGASGGGHGGGAVQISAGQSVRIGPTGVIDASGRGGIGHAVQCFPGGGGSGGAILIEAPLVDIAGFVGANGGGGGGCPPAGGDGASGDPTAASAAGGVILGGAGSDTAGASRGGGCNGGVSLGGGGGGGAGGRLRINTESGGETYPLGLLPTQDSGLATVGSLTQR